MTIEKLTEDQQHRLMDLRIFVPTVTDALLVEKVLRIIYQLTAALEAAERRETLRVGQRLRDAEARVAAAETSSESLQAHVTELEAKLNKAVAAISHKAQLLNERESELATAKACVAKLNGRKELLEAHMSTVIDQRETLAGRVAELEAECERVRVFGDETYDSLMASSDRQYARADSAQSKLTDLRGRVALRQPGKSVLPEMVALRERVERYESLLRRVQASSRGRRWVKDIEEALRGR